MANSDAEVLADSKNDWGSKCGETGDGEQQPELRALKVKRSDLVSSVKKSVFTIGSLIVSFIAFRNSLTWYLQRFWGASGDFWQSQWNYIEDFFDGNDYNKFVWGTFAVTTAVYWIFGTLYTLMDLTGKPKFLLRYKIQDNAPYPVDSKRLPGVIFQVLFNQLVVGIPFGMIAFKLLKFRGSDMGRTLPTFHWVAFELAMLILIEEICFYYSHRLLHHPRIYKYIHKRHHEWTSPIAITAVYCHSFEHLFSNMLPPFLGVFVMGSHIATSWLWFSIALLSTLNAHSGFHFPLFPSPEAHDYHHLKFNQNYGMLGVFDRLHGTDSQFRRSKMYDRHIMLLSLVPLKQLVPDDPKKQ